MWHRRMNLVITSFLVAGLAMGCCCHEEPLPIHYPYRDCDSRPTAQRWACHRDVIDEFLASESTMQDLRGVARSLRYFETTTGIYGEFDCSSLGIIINDRALIDAQEAWEEWYTEHQGQVPPVWWDEDRARYRRTSPEP